MNAPTPLEAALLQRCPACGNGKLFASLLEIAPSCVVCHLDLTAHEKGDGPAFFVIIVVGFLVTALAGVTEYVYEPPYWLHAVIWAPFTLLASLYFLRFFKALIIAAQYKHLGIK